MPCARTSKHGMNVYVHETLQPKSDLQRRTWLLPPQKTFEKLFNRRTTEGRSRTHAHTRRREWRTREPSIFDDPKGVREIEALAAVYTAAPHLNAPRCTALHRI